MPDITPEEAANAYASRLPLWAGPASTLTQGLTQATDPWWQMFPNLTRTDEGRLGQFYPITDPRFRSPADYESYQRLSRGANYTHPGSDISPSSPPGGNFPLLGQTSGAFAEFRPLHRLLEAELPPEQADRLQDELIVGRDLRRHETELPFFRGTQALRKPPGNVGRYPSNTPGFAGSHAGHGAAAAPTSPFAPQQFLMDEPRPFGSDVGSVSNPVASGGSLVSKAILPVKPAASPAYGPTDFDTLTKQGSNAMQKQAFSDLAALGALTGYVRAPEGKKIENSIRGATDAYIYGGAIPTGALVGGLGGALAGGGVGSLGGPPGAALGAGLGGLLGAGFGSYGGYRLGSAIHPFANHPGLSEEEELDPAYRDRLLTVGGVLPGFGAAGLAGIAASAAQAPPLVRLGAMLAAGVPAGLAATYLLNRNLPPAKKSPPSAEKEKAVTEEEVKTAVTKNAGYVVDPGSPWAPLIAELNHIQKLAADFQ